VPQKYYLEISNMKTLTIQKELESFRLEEQANEEDGSDIQL
jgi:hypothetical protein